MPVMDGHEATARIRERDAGGRIPIIALTASTLADDGSRCPAAGMDDFITKPIVDFNAVRSTLTAGAGVPSA